MARDPPFRNTRKVDDHAHVPRVNVQFASRSRTIRIIYCYSFVTFLLELLNANHTEAPSRINATVCYVLSIRISREHSVRKNYLNFRRDLPVSLLLAIHYLSNGCEKLLDVVPSLNYVCTHLTNALIIEHGIVPTKKVVVITGLASLSYKVTHQRHKENELISEIIIAYRYGCRTFNVINLKY